MNQAFVAWLLVTESGSTTICNVFFAARCPSRLLGNRDKPHYIMHLLCI